MLVQTQGERPPPGRRRETPARTRWSGLGLCGVAAPRLPRRMRDVMAGPRWRAAAVGTITGGARAPNMALEATGHSVRFVVGVGLYHVARASAWAFGVNQGTYGHLLRH